MTTPSLDQRLAWFRDAKFGMFVHWGCYSQIARGEQIVSRDMMPLGEYDQLAAAFKPAPDWADRIAQLAVDAGARYVVLTTRHHDGYCLFNTATHDFNATKTGPGRDLISEYVQAIRRAGLKVGFYYSLVNWRWRGFWDPTHHADEHPAITQEVHTQVRELMTNYGHVDILWYDVSAIPGSRTPGANTWTGSRIDTTPAEFYQSARLNADVRKLQPHILINNRSGLPEDFGTPEQRVHPDEDASRAWEACMTLNFAPNWGYLHHSVANKTAGQVLFSFVEAVRLGGNFLFNIGPDGQGYPTEREGDVLKQIGQWLKRHEEAIFETRPGYIYYRRSDGAFLGGQGACYHYGMFTQRGKTAYLTIFYYPVEHIVISRIGPAIRAATLLTTGQPLKVEPMTNARWRISGLPETCPDPLAAVVKIKFEDEPYAIAQNDASWIDGEFEDTGPM